MKFKLFLTVGFLALLLPFQAFSKVLPIAVETDVTGVVRLTQNDIEIAKIVPWVFIKGWKLRTFMLSTDGLKFEHACYLEDGIIDMESSTEIREDGLHVHYKMTPRKTVKVLNVQAFIQTPYQDWEGTSYQMGDSAGKIPSDPVPGYVISQKTDQPLSLGPTPYHGGLSLTLTAPGLQTILQDNRKWSPQVTMIITHGESSEAPWDWKAGEAKVWDFVVKFNRPLVLFPAAPAAKTRGFEGIWQGEQNSKEWGDARIGLVIDKGLKNHYALNYTVFDYGIFDAPIQNISMKGDTIKGQFADGTLIEMRLKGDTIEGKGTTKDKKVNTFHLTRGRDNFIPRLDANGQPVTSYQYEVPQALSDGWETADLRESGADMSKITEGMNHILAGEYPHLDGVLVVQHGKVVLDDYFYGHGPGDEHELRSITKSVLGTLFGIARDQGLVDIHQKLYDIFPDYRTKEKWDSRKDQITLEHLLTMTSGFDGEDDATYSVLTDMFKTDDWLAYCLGLKLVKNPGEHYAYSSSSLTPLGAVLHLKTGLTIPEFAQKVLYDPLGITTTHWRLDSKGTADVEGSFWLRPRDLAKLGQLMLQKGQWNGKPIVSTDWVRMMTSEHISPEKIGSKTKMGYGYLWWTWTLPLNGKNYPGFFGLGRGGQNLIVFPGLDLVIVVTASNYYNDSYFNDSSNFALKYIVPSLKY